MTGGEGSGRVGGFSDGIADRVGHLVTKFIRMLGSETRSGLSIYVYHNERVHGHFLKIATVVRPAREEP